ncbi:MAG: desulfoferrodoxin [Chloroflexi bacterium]|nr:desulfoferrodoxin [Chloroflexota bacterium]
MSSKTGKRYTCKTCNAEFVVTRGGEGDLACCNNLLELK